VVGAPWKAHSNLRGRRNHVFRLGRHSPSPADVGKTPAGGNEVFADGSVQWIKYERMYLLSQYVGGSGPRQFFWYQEDLSSLPPVLIANLSALKYPR